jgi:hypothetical protein
VALESAALAALVSEDGVAAAGLAEAVSTLTGLPIDRRVVRPSTYGCTRLVRQDGSTDGCINVRLDHLNAKHDDDTTVADVVAEELGDFDEAVGFDFLRFEQLVELCGHHS